MKKEHIENICIAYKRFVGPYGSGNAVNMQQFKEEAFRCGMMTDTAVIYATALDTFDTEPDKQRYEIGITVENTLNNHYSHRLLESSWYAVFEMDHTVEAVSAFWMNYTTHIQDLDVNFGLPPLERYDPKKLINHRCEICIPIH